MTDQPHGISGTEAIDKLKDLAKEHPGAARSTIDKVEDAVDAQTGGKFMDWVDRGGDLLEKALGVDEASAPQPAPTPNDPAPPSNDPAPHPAPTPKDPAPPSDDPALPTPNDPAPPSDDPALPTPNDPAPPSNNPARPSPAEPAEPTPSEPSGQAPSVEPGETTPAFPDGEIPDPSMPPKGSGEKTLPDPVQ